MPSGEACDSGRLRPPRNQLPRCPPPRAVVPEELIHDVKNQAAATLPPTEHYGNVLTLSPSIRPCGGRDSADEIGMFDTARFPKAAGADNGAAETLGMRSSEPCPVPTLPMYTP